MSEAYLLSGQSDYLVKLLVPGDDSYERVHREILSALPGGAAAGDPVHAPDAGVCSVAVPAAQA